MSFFERNTEYLFQKSPGLKEALSAFTPSAELEIVTTPAGRTSARFHGVFVHSPRDPEKEADALIAREIPATAGAALIYGFGLGYLAESLIRRFPEIPCLIIEPDIGCFLTALSSRDLGAVLNHPGCVFFLASEPAAVIRYLDTLELASVQIVKLRSLYEKDRAYYERTDALIQSFLKQRDVNQNTLRRFGRLWVRNLVANLKLLCRSPGIDEAKDLFAGIPALVCAGGPSLDGVLPRLPALRERMLVIAVDTTLARLQDAGVAPDFTVISDPQYWNTRHIDWAKPGGSIIVSESSTHPRVFRRLGEDAFLCGSIFPLGRYLESLAGEKGRLGAGGSVATTAWDCARYLGAGPIYLAGLDLGFPGKKTHFRGAYFEEAFHALAGRFRPAETRSFIYLHEALPFPVPANDGGEVLTDQRMAVYKFWFEAQMRLHPETLTRTLSRQGVRIEGMATAEINEALGLPRLRSKIEEKIKILRPLFSGLDHQAAGRLPALKKGIQELLGNLETLTAAASDGARAASELALRRRRGENISAPLRKLDDVDRRITELSAKNIAGFLAGPLINEINRTSDQMRDPEQWLDYSRQLYRELEDSGRFHLDLLRRGLAQL